MTAKANTTAPDGRFPARKALAQSLAERVKNGANLEILAFQHNILPTQAEGLIAEAQENLAQEGLTEAMESRKAEK